MMKKFRNSNIIINTVMLYGLSIAKILFPLLTLPYLTRILSVDSYGAVSYVKSVMQYMQITVDFGFMLSGTKDIVNARDNKATLGSEVGNILLARLLLVGATFLALLFMIFQIDLLYDHALYTLLAFGSVFLSVFLFDYLFRGIEQMQVVTVRFVLMRGISTILTFVFVHGDADVLWIPILDILGSVAAIVMVARQIRKLDIKIRISNVKLALSKLKESAIYFASNMATTAFGALNTVLIGIYLPASDVAYWSVCNQMIAAIQTMYTPITDGIYPDMVKNKDIRLIKKVLLIFMPIILLGSAFAAIVARYVLLIIGGPQYAVAVPIFRCLIPVLIFSFPGIVLGWPTLGALGRVREVTATTIFAAVFQVLGIVGLIFTGMFDLMSLAVLRAATEFVLFASRAIIYMATKRRNACYGN